MARAEQESSGFVQGHIDHSDLNTAMPDGGDKVILMASQKKKPEIQASECLEEKEAKVMMERDLPRPQSLGRLRSPIGSHSGAYR